LKKENYSITLTYMHKYDFYLNNTFLTIMLYERLNEYSLPEIFVDS